MMGQLFKGEKYRCAKLLFVFLLCPGLTVEYLIRRIWVWGQVCKRNVIYVVLSSVWNRAQHKSLTLAWVKESMSKEGREFMGGGME